MLIHHTNYYICLRTVNLGLEMNKSKRKVIIENDTPIHVHTTQKAPSTWDNDSTPEKKQDQEVQRRIMAG